jgi:hypothetical protein
MGVFSYTGAALANLVGNTPGANVSNLVTLYNDLKTFINGGNLDFTNLAATVQSDYVDVLTASATIADTLTGPNNYAVPPTNAGGSTLPGFPSGVAALAFRRDPADYALTSRTARYRIKVAMSCNAVAPGVTFTFGLATPTVTPGASGSAPTVTAIAGVGTAATVTTPAANVETDAVSTEFAAPTAGLLVAYVTISGNVAAGSRLALLWQLQRRTT